MAPAVPGSILSRRISSCYLGSRGLSCHHLAPLGAGGPQVLVQRGPSTGRKPQLLFENLLCARHVAGVIAFHSRQKLQPAGAVYLPFHMRIRGAKLCQTQALCKGTSGCSAHVLGQIAKQPLEVGLMSPLYR